MAVNGGSLEECYSNVFALTQLNGLKWSRFVTPANAPRGVPIPSDYVLKAYGKCLQEGIICTWRRKPPTPPSSQPETLQIPSFTHDISKELWVFWYDQEPEQVAKHTEHLEQINTDDGMEITNAPIHYEVRTLFFKALHTVIERVLMKMGMVRQGRWFTKPLRQPHSGRHHLTPQYCLAFNMQFFVHGGNTVCMTFNPQRQPTLIRLAKRHLDCEKRVRVILGPWSLRGHVLPKSEVGEPSRGQGSAHTQYEEWKEFIPLEAETDDADDEFPKTEEGMPKMVTVEIAGVRMLYPTSLICLTLDEDVVCQKGGDSHSRNHSPMIPDELKVGDKRRNPLLVSEVSASCHFQSVVQNVHLTRRSQPTSAGGDPNFREPFPVQADDDTKWNFIEPGFSERCRCDGCLRAGGQQNPQLPEKNDAEIFEAVLTRQGKQKPGYIYHRRWKNDGTRERSPPVSPVALSDDDEDRLPEWAETNKELKKSVGLNVDTDLLWVDGQQQQGTQWFSDHYTPAAVNGTSSDDENFSCSPFTPVKCISPCTTCEWPNGSLEEIPEHIFSQIFRPPPDSDITFPPNTSQEERAKVLDYYYNPTLRDEPCYMSYHNKRTGEKRRSSYQPPVTVQSSPEQPGSQETIPATTSPPDLDEAENSLAMSRINNLSVSLDTGLDVFAATIPRLKKKLNRMEFNDVRAVDLTCSLYEEDVPSISAHDGFILPSDDEMVDVLEEEEKDREDNEDNEYSPTEPQANVENGKEVDILLSPPDSNEHPQHWYKVGPPSVPEVSMNKIYPTPPSVQPIGIKQEPEEDEPMDTTENTQSQPVNQQLATSQPQSSKPTLIQQDTIEIDQYSPAIKLPEFQFVEMEPEVFASSKDATMNELLWKMDFDPVSSTKEKVEVITTDRFSLMEQKALRKGKRKEMPPDYQKLVRQMTTRTQQKVMIEAPVSTPLAVASSSSIFTNMAPIGHMPPNNAYTINFVATSIIHQPPSMYQTGGPYSRPGMPPMRQMPYATPNPYNMGGYSGMQGPMSNMGNYGMNQMYNHPMGPPMGGMGMGGPMGMPPSPMGMGGMGQGPMGQGPMGMYPNQPMMPHNPMMNPYMDQNNMMPQMSGYMGNQYGMNNMGINNPMPPHMNRPQHLSMMPTPQQSMYNQMMPQRPMVMNEKSPPEGASIVLAIILQDTILDLHYDSAFDACPICSCNVTIRTRELGLYISPPDVLRLPPSAQQHQITSWSGFASSQGHSNTCTCGFSSVRHRYLSFHSGLFPEDAREATGITENAVTPVNNPFSDSDPKLISIPKCFLDPSNNLDRLVLNQLRVMCIRSTIGKIINHLSVFHESIEKACRPQDDGSDIGSNAEYIVSQIDSTELLLLGNSVVDVAMTPSRALDAPKDQPLAYTTFFDQWGLQVANEIREPREAEWRAMLTEITPALEQSMKVVRRAEAATNTVEGPLTWKMLSAKRQKASQSKDAEDDSYLPEPIPQILVATEKDLIRASPQVIRLWEHLSLGPVDQPKDVLYLTVIPDNTVIHHKTVSFMEQLSQLYERMRLGRHIPLCVGDVREGIIRAGGRSASNRIVNRSNFGFLDMIDKYLDDRVLSLRLRLYTQHMEEIIGKVFKEHESIFSRETFREQIALDNRSKRNAVVAMAANADKGASAAEAASSAEAAAPVVKEEGAPVERRASSALEELLQSDSTPSSSSAPGPSVPLPLAPTTDSPGLEPEEIPVDDFGALPHVIVIYMVNPFTWDSENRSAINARIALLALIRAFNTISSQVKPSLRCQLHLEIISLEQVADVVGMCPDYMNDGKDHTDIMHKVFLDGRDHELFEKHGPLDTLRTTALSVYSAPRVLTPECVRAVGARTMTKFGPGSSLVNEINDWQHYQNPMLYNIPCSPFHLAPPPMLTQEGEKIIQLPKDELVLYVSYCLIGGDFLCAAITDEQGRLNDNCLINIRPKCPSNHYRYRNNTQILDGLYRLMNYIQGIISMEVRSWRLVISRVGKMGHGEFKSWNSLLSKSYLRKISNKPKENCTACFATNGIAGMPMILSACLISIEPEPFLRVFPSFFSQDVYSKGGGKKNISTPGDVSATHIMVFTMNTSIDFSSGDQAVEHDDGLDMDFGFGLGDDLGDEFGAILGDGGGSLEMDNSEGAAGHRNFQRGTSFGGLDLSFVDLNGSESVQNQPLASGFYVSTAPAADLPDWFWSSCPSAKRRSPVHLKASLHINNQSLGGDDQGDDLMTSSKKAHEKDGSQLEVVHPLDSQRTDEVLRHVLETYNALSWLNMDATTGDRHSCLPVHIQSLLRLYHSVARVYL